MTWVHDSWGTGTVEARLEFVFHLLGCFNVRIIDWPETGDGYHLVRLASPDLPAGHHGTLEAVALPSRVRFKRWADTG